ncbi:MAG: phage BR0599 family protein [Rickettsiales bacterium]
MDYNKDLLNNYQLFIFILDDNKIIRLTNYPQGLNYNNAFYTFVNIEFNANIISNNLGSSLEIKLYFNENFIIHNNILSSKIEIIPITINLEKQNLSNINYNINDLLALNNNNIKIDILASNPLFFNKCNQYIKKDEFIIIKAELQYNFMNSGISNNLSKYCNAVFGDHRCKVDLSNYMFDFEIVDDIDNISQHINLKNLNDILIENSIRDEFNNINIKSIKTFKNGYLISNAKDNYFKSKIINYNSFNINLEDHLNSKILINKNTLHSIKLANEIKNLTKGSIVQLSLGCNLSFNSCRNFNNAINFRGLPYLNKMQKRFE